ncbi:MAG: peptide ABC transporter substrate-binding protein [Chloroflexota bacterium]
MTQKNRPLSLLLLTFILLVSACQPGATDVGGGEATPSLPSSFLDTPTPAYTPTALPTRVLSVCVGEQPNTLYPLGEPNAAARSVMAAIFDGPFDLVNYAYQPVILETMPSIQAGDAQVNAISVRAGDQVVDANGALILIQNGSRVRPAGCRADNCAITFDGVSPLVMDQMFVEFRLVEGLQWSDGVPVTADDSVFAFDLAMSADTPGSKYIFDRTLTYEAADETTVQWWGIPGFMDPTYYINFWTPLPKHLWEQFSAAQLLTMEVAARSPMGYGPYVMKSWEGDTIRLARNPYYFRAKDGLPKFDELIFRVVTDPNTALSDLLEGRCDVIDSTVHLDAQVSFLLEMRRTGQLQVYTGETPTMEWLSFGINPASYDDRYDPELQKDRPDFFGDARLRQAVAYCLDRQKVVDNVLYGLVPVPDTYVSASHPTHATGLPIYAYNPSEGMKILDNLGWRDHDGNPDTPRQAIGVDRVPPNTPLVISYITTQATQRRQVSEILSQSLADCGIGVTVEYKNQFDFYGEGPFGPLFGRQFDLAEFAMSTATFQPPCARFTVAEIPSAANNWIGTNVGGYKNPLFDAACEAANQALPDEAAYLASFRETQAIFSNDLPAVPLYNRVEIAAARYDFCGLTIDPTSATDLFAIEFFDYGDACER